MDELKVDQRGLLAALVVLGSNLGCVDVERALNALSELVGWKVRLVRPGEAPDVDGMGLADMVLPRLLELKREASA